MTSVWLGHIQGYDCGSCPAQHRETSSVLKVEYKCPCISTRTGRLALPPVWESGIAALFGYQVTWLNFSALTAMNPGLLMRLLNLFILHIRCCQICVSDLLYSENLYHPLLRVLSSRNHPRTEAHIADGLAASLPS